ncbi:MAG: hypothetical protein ACI8XO_001755 [Verrucomicrobiales bacterium]|jgi:hypothetical protein
MKIQSKLVLALLAGGTIVFGCQASAQSLDPGWQPKLSFVEALAKTNKIGATSWILATTFSKNS